MVSSANSEAHPEFVCKWRVLNVDDFTRLLQRTQTVTRTTNDDCREEMNVRCCTDPPKGKHMEVLGSYVLRSGTPVKELRLRFSRIKFWLGVSQSILNDICFINVSGWRYWNSLYDDFAWTCWIDPSTSANIWTSNVWTRSEDSRNY